jgi:hypothetical protein
VCAKSWGIKEEEVMAIWDSNRDTASLFGTAIHQALEHYETHCGTGKTISDKRSEDDNYALPKHPLLKSIIKEFVEINKVKGDVVTEVLLSDVFNGVCGHADRIVVLDWDKKICRVGDYKINVDAEMVSSKDKVFGDFSYLPSNKVSKYQLQMSIYANMLQRSGWTVEALDIYIYESKWVYYELPVLSILTI